ncbi:transketolase [Virgibacillus pantothenticus]|uniref:transketolase n=1 Tax=Virgibacillus pantothenticus TaxID=1473 RepID=UPI001C223631|nr:transketolase [Virgibacillus pantothenticus]MBU8568543.1 transketolase [Virgibacillus pantothenticus]MBU8602486.1 transketolase [Virgibacillus pantothenticus]MBU8636669.1 transketolase [Virgibacillus pantothenticus]MBU8644353.1 transketolase [Virgibacillus pantothenticus]MBU8648487.1 transketolase [Virgibacillus pantothenticus]
MNLSVTKDKIAELKRISIEIRKLIVETVYYAKAGHMGGPMSAVDMLVNLYFNELNINPENPLSSDRDRFVLSKGHSAVALYAVLARRGYFPMEELKTFDAINSRLQAHPDMNALPGLDMSTGSLGMGLSAAVGIALGAKLQKKDFRTYCMVGDGESQEGQIWEAADIASKYKVDNLVAILDYNKLQQFGWVGEEASRANPVVDPEKRWKAFGWNVVNIDGHDHEQISSAFQKAREVTGKPTMIIASTIKGKGVTFMENAYLWHSRVPTDEEYKQAIQELEELGAKQ